MIYKRETHRVLPEQVGGFNKFFDEYLLPNQLKNGAKLIGRWVTKNQDEITTLWEYPSYEEYLKIEERVRKDELHKRAQSRLTELDELFLDMREEFLESTGSYSSPRHTVVVSGYITNERQETLLVKTYWRADTWELPGGGVEEGETLDQALYREILEETGIRVKLLGVTGVYSNGSVVSIVFRGTCIGGKLTTSNETQEVRFQKIDETNIMQYITRSKYRSRVLDAMKENCIPYEAFRVRPYEILKRYEGN